MRLRQLLRWVVVVLVLAGGTLLWKDNHAQQASTPSVEATQTSIKPSPAFQDQTQQTLTDLQQTVKDLQSAHERDESRIDDLQRRLSAEQGERKLLSDQVSGLVGRVDGLGKARAEYTGPARGQRR
jgi:uncharacterized protein HemX